MKSVFTLLLLLIPLCVHAQDATDAKSLTRQITPYLDERVLLVAHVDLTKFDPEATAAALRKAGVPAKQLDEPLAVLKPLLAGLKGAGLKRGFVVYGLDHLPEQPPLLLLPAEGETADALGKLLELMLRSVRMTFTKRGRFLVGATPRIAKRLEGLKVVERPELAEAFDRLGDSPVKVVVLPNATFFKAFHELAPRVPRELGGGSARALTELRWLALGIAPPPKGGLRLLVQADNAATAKSLQAIAERGLDILAKDREAREVLPNLDSLIKSLGPKLDGDRLEVALNDAELVSVILPLINQAAASAGQADTMNRFKQIGLAYHNHAAVYNSRLEGAITSKDGKPLLSWRVALLPFLEQEALYRQFKLDEPWDSEHNKKLIGKMPAIFASTANRRLAADGRTTIVVPRGPQTAFAGTKWLRFQDIKDGTSNTILTVDVDDEHAVIWTKPDDWSYDPQAPTRGLRKHDDKRFLFGIMDGSVRFVPATIDPKTIHALVTPDGGETVQLP